MTETDGNFSSTVLGKLGDRIQRGKCIDTDHISQRTLLMETEITCLTLYTCFKSTATEIQTPRKKKDPELCIGFMVYLTSDGNCATCAKVGKIFATGEGKNMPNSLHRQNDHRKAVTKTKEEKRSSSLHRFDCGLQKGKGRKDNRHRQKDPEDRPGLRNFDNHPKA